MRGRMFRECYGTVLGALIVCTLAVVASTAAADPAVVIHDEDVRCLMPHVEEDGTLASCGPPPGTGCLVSQRATLVGPKGPLVSDVVMTCKGDVDNPVGRPVAADCVPVTVRTFPGGVLDAQDCECAYHVGPSGRANLRCRFSEDPAGRRGPRPH